jgi:hypothetical protein
MKGHKECIGPCFLAILDSDVLFSSDVRRTSTNSLWREISKPQAVYQSRFS